METKLVERARTSEGLQVSLWYKSANFTGCDSDPCVKGDCSEDNHPLAHMGIDYLCACPDGVGGINCEIGKILPH